MLFESYKQFSRFQQWKMFTRELLDMSNTGNIVGFDRQVFWILYQYILFMLFSNVCTYLIFSKSATKVIL